MPGAHKVDEGIAIVYVATKKEKSALLTSVHFAFWRARLVGWGAAGAELQTYANLKHCLCDGAE